LAQRLLPNFEYFFYDQSLTQLQSVKFAAVIELLCEGYCWINPIKI